MLEALFSCCRFSNVLHFLLFFIYAHVMSSQNTWLGWVPLICINVTFYQKQTSTEGTRPQRKTALHWQTDTFAVRTRVRRWTLRGEVVDYGRRGCVTCFLPPAAPLHAAQGRLCVRIKQISPCWWDLSAGPVERWHSLPPPHSFSGSGPCSCRTGLKRVR